MSQSSTESDNYNRFPSIVIDVLVLVQATNDLSLVPWYLKVSRM